MTSLVPNFRECARQWFDDELSATDTKWFLAQLYASMLLASAMEVPEVNDLARIWNSLCIAGRQLDEDAQSRRIIPTHQPDCRVLPNWLRPVMSSHELVCCQCSHTTLFDFRVRDRNGDLISDGWVEYRTHLAKERMQ